MNKTIRTNKKAIIMIICAIALMVAMGFLVPFIIQIKTSTHSYPKYIAPYLYEIYYSDYTEDTEGITHDAIEAFGCSSVRNGNFYGRNFDYIFNDTPEFVVHISATENRHASIGVATHYGLRESSLEKGLYDEQLKLIPNLTMDGINDAGVIASINVAPGKDDVGELTGSNPDGEPLPAAFMVRFVLDNADSADKAVELLKSRNISGTAVSDLYLHIMIADENKTYIGEFINNEFVVEEKTGDSQIMTNFYVNLPELTETAAGVERYNILKEHYDEGSTMVGMRNLLARVKYSNAYSYSNYPAWYSESIPQSMIKNQDTPEFATYLKIFDDIRKDYWNYITNDIRNPANTSFWHTTHNSVYDIEKRQLRLTVQENYSDYYDFYL